MSFEFVGDLLLSLPHGFEKAQYRIEVGVVLSVDRLARRFASAELRWPGFEPGL
ncbi:hypothetical protein ACFQJD_12710 [Haloplanus sp. GCM10025708]|uniref:hypothetical protein n=1 Tax=Haloferacaceae TaxID=1644056 RepID=UPI003622769D